MKRIAICFALSVIAPSGGNSACAQSEQQVIKDEAGSVFMQEVTPPKPAQKRKKIEIDLSNVGVPTDPSGKIVPLINHDAGSVMPLGSQLQVYDEPASNFVPPAVVNPYGQLLNIYGQPVNAFGQQINQFGQPMNTWARLGIPGMGLTPPQGIYPAPYLPNYPIWSPTTNIGINFGRNIGINFNSPFSNSYPWQTYSPTPFAFASPWSQ